MFLLSIGFISAQSFSLSDVLSTFDPSTVVLSILFMIFFAVLYFSTSKMFKGNKAVSVVISLGISLLIIYGINSSTNIQNIYSGLGLSSDTIYTIGSILLIVFLIFIFVKIGTWALLLLGIAFLALSLSGLIFSTEYAAGIGLALIAIWIIIKMAKKKAIVGGGGGSPSGLRVQRPSDMFGGNPGFNKIRKEKEVVERDEQARKRALEMTEQDYQREEQRRKQFAGKLKEEQEETQKQTQRQYQIRAQQQQTVKKEEVEDQELVQKQKQIEQIERKQITSDYNSLAETYRRLAGNYQEVLKETNGQYDPRLDEIRNEMSQVKDEMKRLSGKKV